MGRPNGLRGADRRIPNPFEGVKCDRADNDHGGWLSAHVRASPLCQQTKKGLRRLYTKSCRRPSPYWLPYTILPLLIVVALPFLSCCRLQQIVTPAGVDGV
jgi:hypothetical protein